MLTAAVAKSGDVAAVQRAIDVIADASQPEWQRTALLQGLDAGLPAPGAAGGGGRGGRGGGGGGGLPGLSAPGGRVAVTPGRGVSLPGEPAALTTLAAGTDAIALLAKNVSAKLDWPGRPAPVVTAPPLTAEQQKRFDAGAEIYKNICAGLPPGRWPRQGQARRESRRLAVRDRRRRQREHPDSGRRQGRADRPDAAARPGVERRADCGRAHLYPPRVGAHGAAVDPLNVMEVRGLSKGRTSPGPIRNCRPPAAAAAAGCDLIRRTAAPRALTGGQEF